jgi:CRP-like cAMP-binding protein
MAKPPTGRNFLLAGLPPKDQRRLAPLFENHHMRFRDVLHEPGKAISWVYFPVTGIVSLVTSMEDGATVEAATVGNEGMVGLPMFLETGTIPIEGFVQIPGKALRMRASTFRSEVREGSVLYTSIQRYTQALLRLVAQSAACNRLHSLKQRCARWLLMAHDRVEGNEFFLTQESLSQMLGVRRATVTVAAGELRELGLIRYRQGAIDIVHREGLENEACECYRVIRAEFDRLARNGNGNGNGHGHGHGDGHGEGHGEGHGNGDGSGSGD